MFYVDNFDEIGLPDFEGNGKSPKVEQFEAHTNKNQSKNN